MAYKRKDGRWEERVGGRSVYGETQAEAVEAAKRARFLAGSGYPNADKMTVAEWLEIWIRDFVEPESKWSTTDTYRRHVRNFLIPFVGGLKMAALRPTSMDGLLAAYKAANAKAAKAGKPPAVPESSGNYAARLFRTAIRVAAVKEIIERNPFADVRLKEVKRRDRGIWTVPQAGAFFAKAWTRGDRLAAFYVLAVTMGLRHSELLGLRWKDIDFDSKTLTVNIRLQEIFEEDAEGKRHFVRFELESPKTEKSLRTVPVPESAIAALKEHRKARFAEGWSANEFVFMTGAGTHYRQENVRRAANLTMKKAGVPEITIHDMRHTCANILRVRGLDAKEIQLLLGHSDAGTTQSIYFQRSDETKTKTADTMDAAFGGGRK